MRSSTFAAPLALSGLFVVQLAHAQAVPGVPPSVTAAPTAAPAPAAPGTVPPPVAAQPTAPVPVETASPGTPPPGAPFAAQPQAEPTIYVAQPPLPPLYPRQRRMHDGFYLRLSAGIGAAGIHSTVDGSNAESTVSGGTWGLDVLMGGTPAPGLVIGGGLQLQEIVDAGTSRDGVSLPGLSRGGSGGVAFGMIGPFIDAFPNPTGGFHFGGMVGLAGSSLKDYDDKGAGGLGLSAWVGYMWWASSQWSIGGKLKVTGAWMGREIEPASGSGARFDALDTTRSIQLMFSAAYH